MIGGRQGAVHRESAEMISVVFVPRAREFVPVERRKEILRFLFEFVRQFGETFVDVSMGRFRLLAKYFELVAIEIEHRVEFGVLKGAYRRAMNDYC